MIVFFHACNDSDSSSTFIQPEEKIILKDGIGESWDITHAIEKYKMKKELFFFGIGVGSIASLDRPRVLRNSHPDYPTPDSSLQIFGARIGNEKRAYSKLEMSTREVYNEILPGPKYFETATGFCPIYNLTAVFSRFLSSRNTVLTLVASGWTYGETVGHSLFVLADKETHSLWYRMKIDGKTGLYCISGEYQDEFLEEIILLERMTWNEWLSKNSETKFVTE